MPEPYDRDLLEHAADIRPRPRLHLVVHPDPARAAAAARELASLLDPLPAETLRPRRTRWTAIDSRAAARAAHQHGGPLILEGVETAAGGDTDPLLIALEKPGGRTLIIPTTRPPGATLAGRGHTTLLARDGVRRGHTPAPAAATLRKKLRDAHDGESVLAATLRSTCTTPYGARLADAILRGADDHDLPPRLADELTLRRSRPPN